MGARSGAPEAQFGRVVVPAWYQVIPEERPQRQFRITALLAEVDLLVARV